jgi:hypothetical protein
VVAVLLLLLRLHSLQRSAWPSRLVSGEQSTIPRWLRCGSNTQTSAIDVNPTGKEWQQRPEEKRCLTLLDALSGLACFQTDGVGRGIFGAQKCKQTNKCVLSECLFGINCKAAAIVNLQQF